MLSFAANSVPATTAAAAAVTSAITAEPVVHEAAPALTAAAATTAKSKSRAAKSAKKRPESPAPAELATDATRVAAESASGDDSASNAANTAAMNAADANVNPFVLVVQKRIRTLRKRMTKIEKYEADLEASKATGGVVLQLNEDQLNAISKKDEVAVLIREFEEIQKQLEDKDAELTKKQKKAAKAEKAEQQRKLNAVTEEMQRHYDGQVDVLARFFYAANAVLPLVPTTVISAQEKAAVAQLHQTLTGYEMDPAIEPVAMSLHSQQQMKKLMNFSPDPAVGEISFQRIAAIIETAFAFIQQPPAPEPSFMVSPATPEVDAAESHLLSQEDQVPSEQPAQDASQHHAPVGPSAPQMPASAADTVLPSKLSFMTVSSVLPEEPEEQSAQNNNTAAAAIATDDHEHLAPHPTEPLVANVALPPVAPSGHSGRSRQQHEQQGERRNNSRNRSGGYHRGGRGGNGSGSRSGGGSWRGGSSRNSGGSGSGGRGGYRNGPRSDSERRGGGGGGEGRAQQQQQYQKRNSNAAEAP